MTADQGLPEERAGFAGRIEATGVIGVIVAAGLVVTGLAAIDASQTHQAVTPHTEASESIVSPTNVERSGAMTGYAILW